MNKNFLEIKCKTMNETPGKMHENDGYFCETCMNKGIVYFIKGEEIWSRKCECRGVRKTLRLIAKSGLETAIRDKTFDTFVAREDWQRAFLEKARAFVDSTYYKTFFVGGQPGSGKTHLCTAICNELIKQGKETRYLLWTREIRDLKSYEGSGYEEKMRELRQVEVLYVDDYLKVMRGGSPTQSDMAIAFELLNSRLLDPQKITVISSEFSINELLALDEGTASRICERSGPFTVNIARSPEKNYRLKMAYGYALQGA